MNSLFLFFVIIFGLVAVFCFYNVFNLFPIYFLIKFNKNEFLGFKRIIGAVNSNSLIKSNISKKQVVYNQSYFEEYVIDNSVGDGQIIYSWKPTNFICSNIDFFIITKDQKKLKIKNKDINKFNYLVDNKEIGIINKNKITKLKLTNFLDENNIGTNKIKTYELGTKRCIEKYLEPKKEISVIFKDKDSVLYITDKGAGAILKKINNSFISSVILGCISVIAAIFFISI